VVERLPAYAPELNPVEGLWSSLKAVELANLMGPTLAEVIQQAQRGVERVRHTSHLATHSCGTPASRSHDPSTRHPRPFTKIEADQRKMHVFSTRHSGLRGVVFIKSDELVLNSVV